MGALWRELTDLVLPAGCAGCGVPRAGSPLCEDCRGRLGEAEAWRVRPSPAPSGLPPVHAAVGYADEVRAVLLAHKERGALRLAAPLGGLLARAVRAAVGGRADGAAPVTLVPVPSARRAVAGRGHDPVRRIALAAAGQLRRGGTPTRVLTALRQRRPVADQSGLAAGQRLRNLDGALEAVPGSGTPLAAAEVVLVDDLMTTGASLAEAARAVDAVAGRRPVAAVIAVRSRR
ncbi:ComF family protein [Streptomyces sp. N2-109]|uniref:ComF family protein n=1 Tax=Streptomyces gossypii TaxID=2883101 RepID=A0ABT2JTV8_9ACTN|nr:ComF family protein [Streptomyces gossypii]MCT2591327.1 ComF family protein [Streptomyces gossypii]